MAESIQSIFQRHKGRFGYPDDEVLSLVSAVDAKKQVLKQKSS